MKILLIIDHFGSGGAQRQIVELACGLEQRGHAVEMFIYFPQHNFFRPRLANQRIVVHEYGKGPGFSFGVVWKLASLLRDGAFDVVVSFLSSANIYAELATPLSCASRLIVSERTSHHDDRSVVSAHLRRLMHVLADRVVANSQTHRAWLQKRWGLKDKVSCIYNGVDLGLFHRSQPVPESKLDLRLVAIGRVGPEKNVIGLVRALMLFYGEFGYTPEINWVGLQDASSAGKLYCQRVEELLESLPEIRDRWHWLGVRTDIPQLLRRHHALIHPALYEGLPNVVCEALAAGMPVLISNVCDHPLLVAEGQRGFLFDPNDPKSIVGAIRRLTELEPDDWARFSRNAREYAEDMLGTERMVASYESLFAMLVKCRLAGGCRID
jgi:glycosyltransferase involved in cell wall biosynthesis